METTWRKKIAEFGDTIIACTLSDEELDAEFDDGFGCPEGMPFTAWSERYVYFPVCYDGAERVGRAPRNPCDEANDHVGGW
jgi:hypothetical protein